MAHVGLHPDLCSACRAAECCRNKNAILLEVIGWYEMRDAGGTIMGFLK